MRTSTKIIDTYQISEEGPERYSKRVKMKEIDCERLQPEYFPLCQHRRGGAEIDLAATHAELVEIEREARDFRSLINLAGSRSAEITA
jgi:hypothetical protein